MKILPPEHMKAYLDAAEARGLLPMFYLELVSGLRKGELVALRWDDLDIQRTTTLSVSKQYVRNPDGSLELTRPKTENSVRLVSIPADRGGPADPGARPSTRTAPTCSPHPSPERCTTRTRW